MNPLTRTYKPGVHLFHENDRSRELYIIQSGSVKVYRKIGNREVELAQLAKGAVLGEMALIDGKPRSASAKAVDECCVILIDAETFHEKIKGVPNWFMSIVKLTSQKIRQANQRLQIISSEHQGAKIVLTLQHLHAKFGNGPEIDLNSTKTQLLYLLGASQQRVVKILDFLQKNGFVELSDTAIRFTSVEKLGEYCAFLRLLMRKCFDKMAALPEEATSLLHSITETVPELARKEEGTTDVQGDAIAAAIAACGSIEDANAAIGSLRDAGLLSIQKKESADKATPALSGLSLRVNNQAWLRHYLHGTYSRMVPSI